MSELGKKLARRLLRQEVCRARVQEEGRLPLDVIPDLGPPWFTITDPLPSSELITYERYWAVWVLMRCGWRDERGRAHGGCGEEWGEAKLEGDPDPPADPRGRHELCAERHAERCTPCRERLNRRP